MPAGTEYTYKENMLGKEIRNIDQYVTFEIKNHFLHAVHPLGWISRFSVEINGKEVDRKQMFFVLRGQWFYVPAMHTITEVFWRLGESADIYIQCEDQMPTGKYQVSCIFETSMLEDTRILDREHKWPRRVASVSGEMFVK